MTALDQLQRAVEALHGCKATPLEAVPVRDEFQGAVAWEGTVQVFALTGHPTAARCYAWAYTTDKGTTRYVAVLHQPPVDSPLAAIRANAAADFHQQETGNSLSRTRFSTGR